MTSSPRDVTQLLLAWNDGDQESLGKLIPLLYNELRRLAGRHMRRERADHTLQTTALVHEAYLRLIDQRRVRWQNRAHFIGVASQLMRRILLDHARKHSASKRGGAAGRLSLDDVAGLSEEKELDFLALDDALTSLESIDPRQCRVIELTYFGGLSIKETSEVLGVSSATVKRDLRIARAWLRRELTAR